MATESVRLLVLAHTAFGENKLALHTLSEAYGPRSFLVHVGPKTPMALFLPMNLLEADVTENPKSSLWSARNFQALSPLNGLRGNPYKNSIALFMSEVLYRAVREEGGYEPGLYERCAQQVLTLDALSFQFSNYPIRFSRRKAVTCIYITKFCCRDKKHFTDFRTLFTVIYFFYYF